MTVDVQSHSGRGVAKAILDHLYALTGPDQSACVVMPEGMESDALGYAQWIGCFSPDLRPGGGANRAVISARKDKIARVGRRSDSKIPEMPGQGI